MGLITYQPGYLGFVRRGATTHWAALVWAPGFFGLRLGNVYLKLRDTARVDDPFANFPRRRDVRVAALGSWVLCRRRVGP